MDTARNGLIAGGSTYLILGSTRQTYWYHNLFANDFLIRRINENSGIHVDPKELRLRRLLMRSLRSRTILPTCVFVSVATIDAGIKYIVKSYFTQCDS